MQEEKQEAKKRAAQSQAEARQLAQESAAKMAAEREVIKALSLHSVAPNSLQPPRRVLMKHEAGQQAMRKTVASEQAAGLRVLGGQR